MTSNQSPNLPMIMILVYVGPPQDTKIAVFHVGVRVHQTFHDHDDCYNIFHFSLKYSHAIFSIIGVWLLNMTKFRGKFVKSQATHAKVGWPQRCSHLPIKSKSHVVQTYNILTRVVWILKIWRKWNFLKSLSILTMHVVSMISVNVFFDSRWMFFGCFNL